jgi:hypothetical protein
MTYVLLMLHALPVALEQDCITVQSETKVGEHQLVVYTDECGVHEDGCGDTGSVTNVAFVVQGQIKEVVTLAHSAGDVVIQYRQAGASFEVTEQETELNDWGDLRTLKRTQYTLVPLPAGTFDKRKLTTVTEHHLNGKFHDASSGETVVIAALSTKGDAFQRAKVEYTSKKQPKPRALDVVSSSVERNELVVRFGAKGPKYKLTVAEDLRSLSSERADGAEQQTFRRVK